MKKLMIVAVAAAISAGASAKTLDAQAYDVTLSVKSTTCRDIKYTKTIAKLEGYSWDAVKNDKVTTRKQASTKVVGVIWGCDCETIADPQWRLYQGTAFKTIGGYLFWNPNSREVFNIFTTTFTWAIFNRIDNGEKVEGVWALVNNDADNTVGFVGAGFGKLHDSDDCRIYVKSMSGNFAGFILGGSAANGCMLCGGNGSCQTWDVCLGCVGVVYDRSLSAAYGSWKIKYNKKVSQKLRKTGLITESYTFKRNSGEAAILLAKAETAAAEGVFGATDDDDYIWEGGEIIDKGTVGAAAYGTPEGDWADGEEPETYEGSNPLVEALIDLSEADKGGDAS